MRPLRDGDEMKSFFDLFAGMVDMLKTKDREELAAIEVTRSRWLWNTLAITATGGRRVCLTVLDPRTVGGVASALAAAFPTLVGRKGAWGAG